MSNLRKIAVYLFAMETSSVSDRRFAAARATIQSELKIIRDNLNPDSSQVMHTLGELYENWCLLSCEHGTVYSHYDVMKAVKHQLEKSGV